MVDLIARAINRLSATDHSLIATGKVFINTRERAVFEARHQDGPPVIVKVDTNSMRFTREILGLTTCARAGLPVPAIVETAFKDPAILIMSKVVGDPLTSQSPDEAWRNAGNLLAQMHKVDAPEGLPPNLVFRAWPTLYDQLANNSPEGMQALKSLLGDDVMTRVRRTIESALSDASDRRCLIHGDCQPDHFLIKDLEVTGLIDFGDCGTGDPIWDISVVTLYSEQKMRALLDGYRPDGDFRSGIAQTIDAYRFIRLLGEIAWLQARDLNLARPIDRLRRLSTV